MKEIDELQLIQEVLGGKTASYEKIVQHYYRKLYGYLFKLVQDKHTTEELTQEVFVKAYKNLDKFRQSKCFGVWLFAIGKNTVLDYFKYTRNRKTYELMEDTDTTPESSAQNPEHILLRKETIEMVDDVIQGLPEKYRELILLKYFEELSYDDIAAKLRMSSKEVKWKLHQARRKMVQSIEKQQAQESGCNLYGV